MQLVTYAGASEEPAQSSRTWTERCKPAGEGLLCATLDGQRILSSSCSCF